MKKIIENLVILGLACVIIGICGCNSFQNVNQPPTADNMPTYDEFIAHHTFPYHASPERQNSLRQAYANLDIGLTKSQVTATLGKPDYSELLFSKEATPGYLGFSWTYFFEKPDPKITNVKNDKVIQVFFDINEKTKWIISNIKDLDEIGSPSR